MELIDQAKDIQEQIDSTFTHAYKCLQHANIEHGISLVSQLAYTVPIEDSIKIKSRSIMGTEIPLVDYTPDENQPTYSFSTTDESIDRAREAFRKVKELTIKLSMIENAAYRLATNIKKTQKRANALKNITIPTYTTLVSSISNALEEKEREEFTRLKSDKTAENIMEYTILFKNGVNFLFTKFTPFACSAYFFSLPPEVRFVLIPA